MNYYKPSNLKQGYVLRKLLREFFKIGGNMQHEYYYDEIRRQDKISKKYQRLKDRYHDKPKEWWFDTHGIDLDEVKEQLQ